MTMRLIISSTVAITLAAAGCDDRHESGEGMPELRAAWVEPSGGGVFGAPVVAAGLAIAADDDGVLRAVDVGTGVVRWTASLTGTASMAPVADDERVYVVTEGGDVSAFGLATGNPVWSMSLRDRVAAGLGLGAGRVTAVTTSGSAVGLDVATGEIAWSADIGGDVVVTPAVDDDVILVASLSGTLTRLDQTTGAVRWQVEPDPNYVIGTPVVTGAIAVVPGYEDTIYGVSVLDGDTRWSRYGGNYLVALPAIRHGVVYFGAAHGPVHAVAPDDGALLWTAPEVLFGRQAILVPTDAYVLVVELGGAITWIDASDGASVAVDDLAFDVNAVTLGRAANVLVVAGTDALYGFGL